MLDTEEKHAALAWAIESQPDDWPKQQALDLLRASLEVAGARLPEEETA